MTGEEKINTLKAIIQECEEYQWQRKEALFEIIKDLEQETVLKERPVTKYTVNINGLKISGSAEEIHRLSTIYGLASCEYGHHIVEEINGKHRDNLIAELSAKEKALIDIEKQLIDAICDSDYYKHYSSEMSDMIDSILKEIEHEQMS